MDDNDIIERNKEINDKCKRSWTVLKDNGLIGETLDKLQTMV